MILLRDFVLLNQLLLEIQMKYVYSVVEIESVFTFLRLIQIDEF